MNVTYQFIAYEGSIFTNENNKRIEFQTIQHNFYMLNGRKGKILKKGTTEVFEHGFSGSYESFGFVYQDDLTTVDLNKFKTTILEFCPNQ